MLPSASTPRPAVKYVRNTLSPSQRKTLSPKVSRWSLVPPKSTWVEGSRPALKRFLALFPLPDPAAPAVERSA